MDRGREEASVFGFGPTCVGRRKRRKSEFRTLEAAKKKLRPLPGIVATFPTFLLRHPLSFFPSSLTIVAFVSFLCVCVCVCMSIHSLYGVKVYVSIFFPIFFSHAFFWRKGGNFNCMAFGGVLFLSFSLLIASVLVR